MWKHIKSKQLNNKRFTKQHSIAHYIVDFYCVSEKLIIELDGQVHCTPNALEYVRKRTTFLESLGYKVIHFENKMVFDHLPSVLQEIKETFNSEEEDKPAV